GRWSSVAPSSELACASLPDLDQGRLIHSLGLSAIHDHICFPGNRRRIGSREGVVPLHRRSTSGYDANRLVLVGTAILHEICRAADQACSSSYALDIGGDVQGLSDGLTGSHPNPSRCTEPL